MATLTVYPDPNVETSTFDGFIRCEGTNQTLATYIAGNGTSSDDSDTLLNLAIGAGSTSDRYSVLCRAETLFDTSALTSSASISAAVWSGVAVSKLNGLSGETSTNSRLHIVAATTSSNTAVTNSDYQAIGATSFGTTDTQQNTSTAGYNDVTLDSNGIANVSKTSISKFGIRYGWDINNTTTGLTWSSGQVQAHRMVSADEAGTGSDPKLTITYTISSGANHLLLLGIGT